MFIYFRLFNYNKSIKQLISHFFNDIYFSSNFGDINYSKSIKKFEKLTVSENFLVFKKDKHQNMKKTEKAM